MSVSHHLMIYTNILSTVSIELYGYEYKRLPTSVKFFNLVTWSLLSLDIIVINYNFLEIIAVSYNLLLLYIMK